MENEKKDPGKKNGRRVIAVAAVVIIAFVTGLFIKNGYDRDRAGTGYDGIAETAGEESVSETGEETGETADTAAAEAETGEETEEAEEETAAGSEEETNEYTNGKAVEAARENLKELKEINPDIIGWLTVPGTSIDYPILKGDDNDYYLHRDWKREENAAGSIFLDYACDGDFSGRHSVIYGHHMKDGSMFKDLMKFREKDFFDSHRYIYIYTDDGVITLRTFACTYVPSEPIRRKTDFSSDDEFYDYIDGMISGAEINYGYNREDLTHLYSFITCSYEFDDARTILYAYEI